MFVESIGLGFSREKPLNILRPKRADEFRVRLLLASQEFFFLLTPRLEEKSTVSYYFLFSSVQAAQEVAHSLRGKWDYSNGVEFEDYDYPALELAAALCNAAYCRIGDYCNIWMKRFLSNQPYPFN